MLKRYNIFDRDYVERNQSELPLWIPDVPATTGAVGADALELPSLNQHPLLKYTFIAKYQAEYGFACKPLHRPNLVKSIYVHGGFPMDGARSHDVRKRISRPSSALTKSRPASPRTGRARVRQVAARGEPSQAEDDGCAKNLFPEAQVPVAN